MPPINNEKQGSFGGRAFGGGNATPMTYRSPARSRRFVVVAAGCSLLPTRGLGPKLVAIAPSR
ncbi:hypothetical protein BY998_1174 [Methylobacterium sp. B4]|nr:hypothetical protein BY998_1174 [Methylobacterium sp. B4]